MIEKKQGEKKIEVKKKMCIGIFTKIYIINQIFMY